LCLPPEEEKAGTPAAEDAVGVKRGLETLLLLDEVEAVTPAPWATGCEVSGTAPGADEGSARSGAATAAAEATVPDVPARDASAVLSEPEVSAANDCLLLLEAVLRCDIAESPRGRFSESKW